MLIEDIEFSGGKSDILLVNWGKKKYTFKLLNASDKIEIINLCCTLCDAKKPGDSGRVQQLIKFQPSIQKNDWKLLMEVAKQYSEENTSAPSYTAHTFENVYSLGDVIISQDQRMNRFMHIIEGSANQERTTVNIDGISETRTLRVMGMDEVGGEIGFFSPELPHFAVVAAEAKVKVLEISHHFLQAILFAHSPHAVVRFYDLFCRSLASHITQELVQK